MKGVVRFFDKLEDKIRARLSRVPILYAVIGGTGMILFWRGIWMLADELYMSSIASIAFGVILLLATGLLVTSFIGEQIILSGLRREKKLVDKTEAEILADGVVSLVELKRELKSGETIMVELKKELDRMKVHIEHLERASHLDQ